MEFALTKDTPVSKWWKPKLIFTGVSIMGINPESRKFNRSCPALLLLQGHLLLSCHQ